MKLHDLAAAQGCDQGQAPGRPRHRRQGRQDGRPRHQGPGRPRHRAGRLRGWPAAPDAAHPQAARGSRTRSGSPTRRSTSARWTASDGDEIDRRDAWSTPAWPAEGRAGQDPGRRDAVPGRPGRGPRLLEVGRGRHHRRRRSRRPGPAALRPRAPAGLGQRPHQPVASARPRRRGAAMLSQLANIFRVPDLRNKVLFTLAIIALYQFGANVPVPVRQLLARSQSARERGLESSGVLGFLNLFCGGALARLAVFGLGVMPYITSSHHHPAALHGHPQARGVARPGRGRPEEDHPDHPVPDRGPGPHAVDRAWSTLSTGTTRPCSGTSNVDLILNSRSGAGRLHGPDPDRRHGLRHVAGRAHHPARHRPGHVHPDLRQRGGRHPHRASTPSYQEGGKVKFAVIIARLAGPAGAHRLRRPGPAADTRDLRQAGGGAHECTAGSSTYIPLKVNQSGVIPIIFASSVLYIPVLLSNVIPSDWLPELRAQQPDADQLLLHPRLLRPHPALHVLLRLRGLRPAPAGRPHPQAGRVHPRHPARAADRALPRPHPEPDHRGRAPCSWARWPWCPRC